MVLPSLLDVSRINEAHAMADNKKFIQKATKNAHGQFKAKAESAGKSTREYAEEHKHDSGKTGKQARLAITLMSMHKGKHKSRSASETRNKLYGKNK